MFKATAFGLDELNEIFLFYFYFCRFDNLHTNFQSASRFVTQRHHSIFFSGIAYRNKNIITNKTNCINLVV